MAVVDTVENHDAAYGVWKAAGVRHRTLIHLDAHHDMHWVADPRDITIGNFIARALAEDLLDAVYWVVPDGTWTRAGLRAVRRHLRALRRTYPTSGPLRHREPFFEAELIGKRLIVCTLRNLPRLEQPLLDIDVDYLIMPSASFSADQHGAIPWCWPSDLVRRLTAAGVSSDLTTIAYSVEGGYTPLQWKHLGDELSALLSAADCNDDRLAAMQLMGEGAMLESRGDRPAAERYFLEAAAKVTTFAAPWYRLSRLEAGEGRTADARAHFDRAVTIDSSYYTAYDGGGFWAWQHSRWDEAERAFHAVLSRDPEHEFALTGLGLLAARRKRWDQAERFARAALARNDTLVDAHRVLGAALAGRGRDRVALASYDRSLGLVLAGCKPFLRPLSTDSSGGTPEDPGHASTYERIGEIHMRLGEPSKAIDAFRFAIAAGNARTITRARVAALCLKTGDWRGALTQVQPPRSARIASRATASMDGTRE
jgi:tetratricopeptide (TPR) repeat protein